MQNMEQHSQQNQAFHDYIGYQSSSTPGTDSPYSEYERPQPPYSPEPLASDPYAAYQTPLSSQPSNTLAGSMQGALPAVLCYVGLWLSGFLFLLFEKKDRFIRFHAMQSLLFFGAVNVLYVVFISLMSSPISFVAGFAIFAFVVMNVVAVVAWFVGLIGALHGRYVKLPFVGEIAERYVNNSLSPK
ncbi:MAG TPA: hypothetical protein VL485_15915 [Ktedonobacteraceae bacterium]|jgi:uncharacterized membrane protein|nr:hypothetical protein [Ktedonobacteraceae bacterium]